MAILAALAVVGLAAGAMVVLALVLRRRLLSAGSVLPPGETFTIGDLRQLRDSGRLTEAEYERARRVLIARGLSALHENGAAPDEASPSDAVPGDGSDNPSDQPPQNR